MSDELLKNSLKASQLRNLIANYVNYRNVMQSQFDRTQSAWYQCEVKNMNKIIKLKSVELVELQNGIRRDDDNIFHNVRSAAKEEICLSSYACDRNQRCLGSRFEPSGSSSTRDSMVCGRNKQSQITDDAEDIKVESEKDSRVDDTRNSEINVNRFQLLRQFWSRIWTVNVDRVYSMCNCNFY